MVMAGAVARRKQQHFKVGSNVLAKWKKGKWFLAHVTGVHNGRYNVYFPGDSMTKDGLGSDDVRELEPSASVYSRADMLGKTFYFEGEKDLRPGDWKVRRVVDERNVYVCTRLTGGTATSTNCDEFDIGYVISCVVRQDQKERES